MSQKTAHHQVFFHTDNHHPLPTPPPFTFFDEVMAYINKLLKMGIPWGDIHFSLSSCPSQSPNQNSHLLDWTIIVMNLSDKEITP